jgi:hypothetical protein
MSSKYLFLILIATLLTFAAAGTSMADPGSGGNGNSQRSGNGGGGGTCDVNLVDRSSLTPDEIEPLLFVREEEKVARDSYLVLGELWGLAIFDNIAVSEQKHMDAVKALIDCYKLTDPVIDQVGVFSDHELQDLYDFLMLEGQKSMMDGLYVGAAIEETDIVDIQHAIEQTLHTDIVSTYDSLMCGSRNHLRAFIRQIEINGGSYTPTVLDADEFWEIAYSDMEQDCTSN